MDAFIYLFAAILLLVTFIFVAVNLP